MLVTASVDAIQLRKRLAIETDMTIQGQVVWTGSSSMDIRMELVQVSMFLLFTHLYPPAVPAPPPLEQAPGQYNRHGNLCLGQALSKQSHGRQSW